jgi:signal peptidase II
MVSTAQSSLRTKLVPLLLTVALFALDQATKALVVAHIPVRHIGAAFFGDLIRIIHVYNPGIAFSIGNSLPLDVRNVVFALLPLAIVALVFATYIRSDDFTRVQRWAIAAVIGGGLGNLADRFFRNDGVVDFIDIKFFGIFGLERWPTFNVADMSVLIGAGIFMASVIIAAKNTEKSVTDTRHTMVMSGIIGGTVG